MTYKTISPFAVKWKIRKYSIVLRNKRKDHYVIMKEDFVYSESNNKKSPFGKFVYEPLPSNRDQSFISHTRFSLEQAFSIVKRLIKKTRDPHTEGECLLLGYACGEYFCYHHFGNKDPSTNQPYSFPKNLCRDCEMELKSIDD